MATVDGAWAEPAAPPAVRAAAAANRAFYEPLWADARLQPPERFNTWPLVAELTARAGSRLEVGPGLRPRLPIPGTHFIDLSAAATDRLSALGGLARRGDIAALPFPDRRFDLVCALDIIEHVADDQRVMAELGRVLADGGILLCSVPLHAAAWTGFDDLVGHVRRYEPDALLALFARHGFAVERSAAYGMKPRPRWLVNFGMWCLRHFRGRAMFFYNRVFMPLGLRFQKALVFVPGMIDPAGVDEIILVLRRTAVGVAADPRSGA